MPSILTLLALSTAHAVTLPVSIGENGGSIQNKLDNMCASNDPENTLLLPVGELNISSGEVLVYPNPSATIPCVANPGNLTIAGNTNQQSTIVVGISDTPQNLLTILPGVDVTVRDVEIRGLQFGDPGSEDIDPDSLVGPGLEDLVVTQCAASYTLPPSATRGIFVDGSSVTAPNQYTNLTLERVEMRCLYGQGDGGAVFVQGGGVTVIDSKFTGNQATGSGGAIGIRRGGSAQVYRVDSTVPSLVVSDSSRFERNIALFGGAISNYQGGNASRVESSYFYANTGNLGAGALQFDAQSNVIVERNQFDQQNSRQFDPAQRGGAVTVETGDALMFKNNLVCGSWAGRGGGLYVDSVSDVDVVNSVFAENGAIEFGGGVFFSDSDDIGMDIRVVNNTFAGNESGRLPPFVAAQFVNYVIGGGGAASFFGVNPIFQNNIVAYTEFGGGVFGEYVPFSTNGFQIGDPLIIFNNLFYNNDDGQGSAHITGDFAAIASHPSNVLDADPRMQYLGLGEYNCVPEAFYTQIDSPAIDAGGNPPAPNSSVPTQCFDMVDTTVPPDFEQDTEDGPCDIGAFGGEFALFRKDSDLDGVPNLFDCNDLDGNIAPGQPEICDFDDNDCNGIVDDGLDIQWYPDLDQDLFGDENGNFILDCEPVPGLVPNKDDCDDQQASVYAGAAEVCDDLDNDCNGLIDDGLTYILWYPDQDGDGFGANNPSLETCTPPGGVYVTEAGDCADNDPNVSPISPEVCDGIDNDCDGLVDAADEDSSGVESFYPDNDGDGFGDITAEVRRCADDPPPTGIRTGGDCDDANPDINQGAPELCLNVNVDEDCDGAVDEVDENTGDALRVYQDADGDGFGSSVIYQDICASVPPPGFVTSFGDCDDNDANVDDKSCQPCGCSASTVPTGSAMFLVGLLGAMVRRRR